MVKKIALFIGMAFLLFNLYGCIPILAGAAGGAGTATWLSGKLSQEVDASYDQSIQAVKSAFKSLRLTTEKQTVEKDIAQFISKYKDGKTIWVDVRPITESRSRIDVRVGAISGDKAAADTILKQIARYL